VLSVCYSSIMKKIRKQPELMAPAGDWTMLRTAVKSGADAVYFGVDKLNMRAKAKNFSIGELSEISKFCHSKKVRTYLTLNTIVFENELSEAEQIIKAAKRAKIDRVICSDLAVAELCNKNKMPFCISTQSSISNSLSASVYKKLGAKRIVLARELNLKQIKKISKIIDVECFIHGAMCVAVSGRCLTSQFLFGKSANRGQCLHPCRRSYLVKDLQEGYELEVQNDKILSAKDLCTLPFIEKMKKAGIKSLKIEGRNRESRYVDTVVSVYRKALDKKLDKKEIEDSLDELNKVYNKGFSSGFYLGLPTADDFATIEHSAAKEKKHFVGKVLHYYPKIGVATIKLVSGLKVGDEINVIGKTTGLIKSKIESMEKNNQALDITKKGDEVGLKLPLVRKNDEVYLIKK